MRQFNEVPGAKPDFHRPPMYVVTAIFCYLCIRIISRNIKIMSSTLHSAWGTIAPFLFSRCASWLCPLADPPQLGDSRVNIDTQRRQLVTSELSSLGSQAEFGPSPQL